MRALTNNYHWWLLILVVVLGVGLIARNEMLIRMLDEELASLRQEAAELELDVSRIPTHSGRLGPRALKTLKGGAGHRSAMGAVGARGAQYPRTAKGLLELAVAFQQLKYDGESEGLESQRMVLAMTQALLHLSPGQIAELLELLRDQPALPKQTREEIAGDAMEYLKDRDFDAFLKICLGPPNPALPDHLFGGLFFDWGIRDPDAAIAWIRQNQKSRTDLITQSNIKSAIVGAGDSRPSWAFELLKEFKVENDEVAAATIIHRATTDDRRLAALTALRDYIHDMDGAGDIDYFKRRAYRQFVYSLRQEGLEGTMDWLNGADFSQDELYYVARGLDHNTVRQGHQQWFEWLDQKLPDEQRDEQVAQMVSDWTEYDFIAAGTWLDSAPEGGWMRSAALPAYVRTVARVDPLVAEQWALTLPASEERQSLMRAIHDSWPREDAQGKAEFAKKHGF